MSCLRRGRTQRIREISTLVGLSWLQAPPAPEVRISGRRLTIAINSRSLIGRHRRLSEQNGQDAESWIRITPDRGCAASFHYESSRRRAETKRMSTSRSNSLFSEDAKRGIESLLSPYSPVEGVTSVMLAGGGECAINQQCARQGGPFDHVAMIARPCSDAGAPERIYHGKQNVNRRHPPGGNQGGGDARQPR